MKKRSLILASVLILTIFFTTLSNAEWVTILDLQGGDLCTHFNNAWTGTDDYLLAANKNQGGFTNGCYNELFVYSSAHCNDGIVLCSESSNFPSFRIKNPHLRKSAWTKQLLRCIGVELEKLLVRQDLILSIQTATLQP